MTLVELLIVMVIISIVIAIAQPNLQKAVMKARATSIIGDLQVVRVAVLTFQADNHRWPGDRSRGFAFTTPLYTLDYDNWSDTGPFDVGVSVITTDQTLGWTLLEMLGPNAWAQADRYSWIIDG
jgi:prepilin-type N-terminal cleavage/methylation domain-containing protein